MNKIKEATVLLQNYKKYQLLFYSLKILHGSVGCHHQGLHENTQERFLDHKIVDLK
jgi:hypothetical protein